MLFSSCRKFAFAPKNNPCRASFDKIVFLLMYAKIVIYNELNREKDAFFCE